MRARCSPSVAAVAPQDSAVGRHALRKCRRSRSMRRAPFTRRHRGDPPTATATATEEGGRVEAGCWRRPVEHPNKKEKRTRTRSRGIAMVKISRGGRTGGVGSSGHRYKAFAMRCHFHF